MGADETLDQFGYEVWPGCYYEIWDMYENVFEDGELFYTGIQEKFEIGDVVEGLPLPDGCKEFGITGIIEYPDGTMEFGWE